MSHVKLFIVVSTVLLVAVACDAPAPPEGGGAGESGATAGFAFEKDDRICLLGNALAERMQHHGWLEARLQTRLPELGLSFRNLGFSADELTVQQRTSGFGSWHDWLTRCRASVVFAFFGFVESFAGADGIESFERDLEEVLAHMGMHAFDGEAPPRVVLFSPIPFEDTGDPHLPDAAGENARLLLYRDAMARVAEKKGVTWVDLFGPMQARFDAESEALTINGVHLSDRGNAVLAEVAERALCGPGVIEDAAVVARVREAVLEKNLLWFNRYRATDGYNVYGGRSSLKYEDDLSNFTVLQRELEILDAMAERHTDRIHSIARLDEKPLDLAGIPEPIAVKTNIPGPRPDGAHEFLGGEEAIAKMTVAPGMKVELFADEARFPELANPVQMAWDTRGRLWVAVWPTYPHWAPGEPLNDKLIILEDTDGDGRADVCKTFVDDLHNPTGFEFWNGGVIVANAPDLLFLEDTDGDDVADRRERILHGLSSADTHHSVNSFVLGPDGALYFQEGTFHMSQVESIHGPVRNRNGCVWRYEPRTRRVERHVPYNFANPHGHVFDAWGQNFVTDGTGNVNYYALPFSGHVEHPDKKRSYFSYFKQRSRPCAGTEILSSSHFPGDNRGNLLIANVIGFRGIFQYRYVDDGSGFGARETDPIVFSSDTSFRPADIEVGPDGAIYFLDWYNPIIGHMQHHLRDPNRDKEHGRVYRVTWPGRAVVAPVPLSGRPTDEVVAALAHPDDRVRYRARIELSARDSEEVSVAAHRWVAGLEEGDPAHEHHVLEALWLHQQHDRADRDLLERCLAAADPRARAAATRVVRGMRHRLPDAPDLLKAAAADEHPRVRLEAVVAASFLETPAAVEVALEALRKPLDKFLEYALAETMRTLEPVWKAGLRTGELDLTDNPQGIAYLLGRVDADELVRMPRTPAVLEAILTRRGVRRAKRREAAVEIAAAGGGAPQDVVLAAIEGLDRGRDGRASHVVPELGALLDAMMGAGATVERGRLLALAEEGSGEAARRVGYAALVAVDGDVEQAWRSALKSRAALVSFLGAVPAMEPSVRTTLRDRIRPMMFEMPAEPGGVAAAEPGLAVTYYGVQPRNAAIETVTALPAEGSARVATFTLDTDVIRDRETFALLFRGLISAPTEGEYRFFTRSDDGSRLYVDGRLVVDNDGLHGMSEKGGSIMLSAGAHDIVVTFFEGNGAEGLEVSWKGPGFDKEIIPAAALSTDPEASFRGAAIRAVASMPAGDREKLADAAALIAAGELVAPALDLVRSTSVEGWESVAVTPVLEAIGAFAAGVPATSRTSPQVVAALETGRDLTRALPGPEARKARARLAELGGTVLLVKTVPHRMIYDRTELWAAAGKPVAIVFSNNDMMPHNLVVTRPGAMKTVGDAAEAMAKRPDAGAKSYVPDLDEVLWSIPLVNPGGSERLEFVAPSEVGDYPYVCTYPGHWRVMNGVLHVVQEIPEGANDVEGSSEQGPARDFVRNWTFADVAPEMREGWERGRDLDRGRELFTAAGCIKCHVWKGEGEKTGVDLTMIGEKYRGRDLLRHVVEPSFAILEGYENFFLALHDGKSVVGRIAREDGDAYHVVANPDRPDELREVRKTDVEEKKRLKLSSMPTGLLVTLTEAEILDLLAFLQAGR